MIITHDYCRLEKWIIAFVSLVALSFLYEVALAKIDWGAAVHNWVIPSFPQGSIVIIMSVLGAVVMPHNLFLHSEIIQSRQWNLEDEKTINRQLDYEFLDTLFSMIVGWAINSAMILIAAATFFKNGIRVSELQQTYVTLRPLLGSGAQAVFAIALLLSGIASSITSGVAAGSIFSGFYGEPYQIANKRSRIGVAISLFLAVAVIFAIRNPFQGLIYSQMVLSMQLPITIFLQVYLTSSKRVMKRHANRPMFKTALIAIGIIVTALNIKLLAYLL
jgi:manganese transport protein